MGLTDTQTIGRIIVHPTDPNTVYVAASGHEWTDNEMRGVFKTTNGGKSWDKIYYKSARTGASDLMMDPRNPDVLYASLWQRIHREWSKPTGRARLHRGRRDEDDERRPESGRMRAPGCRRRSIVGGLGSTCRSGSPDTLYRLVDNYEIGRQAKPGQRDA